MKNGTTRTQPNPRIIRTTETTEFLGIEISFPPHTMAKYTTAPPKFCSARTSVGSPNFAESPTALKISAALLTASAAASLVSVKGI
jgi:hypothetical protein